MGYEQSNNNKNIPCNKLVNENHIQWEQIIPEYLASVIANDKSNFDLWAQDLKDLRVC